MYFVLLFFSPLHSCHWFKVGVTQLVDVPPVQQSEFNMNPNLMTVAGVVFSMSIKSEQTTTCDEANLNTERIIIKNFVARLVVANTLMFSAALEFEMK